MGLLHAGIMNSLEGVRLSAISDTSSFLLKVAKGLKDDIAIYSDYRRMLDKEKPDAVVITTPVFLHVPMGWECAQRGISFLMEKPLSTTSTDAAKLVQEVKKQNVITMIGYMMRYMETFAKGREIIKSGVLGKLIRFKASMYVSQLFRTGKGWRYKKEESGGGVVIGQATHLIDLLHWYFGSVERVSAHTRNWYSTEVEDFAHVHLEFKAGITGWFDSSWSVRHHRLLETTIDVDAENGTLHVSDDYVKLYLDEGVDGYHGGWTNYLKPDLFQGVPIDLGGPQYTRQDMIFVECLKNGRTCESDVESAFEVQRIVDAIYTSSENHGEPVSMEQRVQERNS